jgi:septal ring factor EnvC (AmiA/AmiB activator)
MSEYKTAIMELVLLVGSKTKRINELKEQIKELERENDWVHGQLGASKKENMVLRNDLKDLSTEFNRWRNGKTKKKETN